tara:strand:+ start:253 stop:669 length:417 start_codon:yes stop_codon:yes gene_type:complete
MAFLYKAVDKESGYKWCVRVVYWHDSYGLNDMLTLGGDYTPEESPDNPLVEFYDMDSLIAKTVTGNEDRDARIKERGQFVSRYYLDTLNESDWSQGSGLNLEGGVARWGVSGDFMVKAMEAVNADVKEWMEDQMLGEE